MIQLRLPLAAALVALAGAAAADTIYLTAGEALDEVTVVDETLAGVIYRPDGAVADKSIEFGQVLRVEYSRKPRAIDEADTLAAEGSLADALAILETFVQEIEDGTNKKDRQKWAPAYALRRILEINVTLGDLNAAVAAADKLIQTVPESAYVPRTYLTKAEAQRGLRQDEQALATLDALRGLIDEKLLPKGWQLEADLGALLSSAALSGSAKRDRIGDIISAAGSDYPLVRNRAFVAEGESYLQEDKPDLQAALVAFRKIAEDPTADPATLAGAHAGIGECLYRQVAGTLKPNEPPSESQAKSLREALKSLLRVVVVYRDQSRYVQSALFHAGRSFDLFGTDEQSARARQMYARLISDYPSSPAAAEAKRHL